MPYPSPEDDKGLLHNRQHPGSYSREKEQVRFKKHNTTEASKKKRPTPL